MAKRLYIVWEWITITQAPHETRCLTEYTLESRSMTENFLKSTADKYTYNYSKDLQHEIIQSHSTFDLCIYS